MIQLESKEMNWWYYNAM